MEKKRPLRTFHFYTVTGKGELRPITELAPPVMAVNYTAAIKHFIGTPEFKSAKGDVAIVSSHGAPYVADAKHIKKTFKK